MEIIQTFIFIMVSWWRFELQTDRLEGDCSIQLSYQDIRQYKLYNISLKKSTLFIKKIAFFVFFRYNLLKRGKKMKKVIYLLYFTLLMILYHFTRNTNMFLLTISFSLLLLFNSIFSTMNIKNKINI